MNTSQFAHTDRYCAAPSS